jgi:hypothetical protein
MFAFAASAIVHSLRCPGDSCRATGYEILNALTTAEQLGLISGSSKDEPNVNYLLSLDQYPTRCLIDYQRDPPMLFQHQ